MKRSLAAVAAILVCQPAFAVLTCEKMEFAELQSKNRKELDDRYCDSLKNAGFLIAAFRSKLDFARQFSAIGARSDAAKTQAEATKDQEDADLCRREAVRSSEQLQKRFKAKIPNCAKKYGEHWKPEWDLGGK